MTPVSPPIVKMKRNPRMNSIGTLLWTWWAGEPVGTDRFGNPVGGVRRP